jgi:hypothetical protein
MATDERSTHPQATNQIRIYENHSPSKLILFNEGIPGKKFYPNISCTITRSETIKVGKYAPLPAPESPMFSGFNCYLQTSVSRFCSSTTHALMIFDHTPLHLAVPPSPGSEDPPGNISRYPHVQTRPTRKAVGRSLYTPSMLETEAEQIVPITPESRRGADGPLMPRFARGRGPIPSIES